MRKLFVLLLFTLLYADMTAQQAARVRGELLVQVSRGTSPSVLEDRVVEQAGILPAFTVKECISDYMQIWLCSFNEEEISATEMLRVLRTIPSVKVAQVNHVISERLVPDDPFFGQQWHHVQAEDHDIDTDLAWNTTTGGSTASGDDIVVCIIEFGGSNWAAADLVDNHWINENEIPDNNIDDDNNGFTDDYDGWNTSSNTDNISSANHGSQVSSMIGSTGNNTTGVTGVNWDVKLMQVQIGGISEANAIAGYTYPLIMRKLYNETNGAQGAFVVATNTSWGTNGGQPDDAPLWCAMYDSLGYYGVISCGATANNNVDVDAIGDLPTACPSEHLLSVTATNSSDQRTFSAFGLTTIDIAAPGGNVYLANATAYGNANGTSFASPCAAGAIALLYAAPCNSLMQIVVADPAAAALIIKNYIMDGVDTTTQLTGETVTGGRLNVNNSMELLMEECDNTSCIPPFGISVALSGNETDYLISWSALENMTGFSLRYKPTGSAEWITISDIADDSLLITGLLTCTGYEVQLSSACNSTESAWSEPVEWTTNGCCINPDVVSLQSFSSTTASITWNEVLAAGTYNIFLSVENTAPIEFTGVEGSTFSFTDLLPCTDYNVAVWSACIGDPPPPVGLSFHTAGCTDCGMLEYCVASASANAEYIGLVQLGNINRSSESDGGYVLVEGMTTTLSQGQQYTISCAPGYAGQMFNENLRAWIDFNSDEDFDDLDELVFDAPAPTMDIVSGQFVVPSWVQNGSVRMRVAMRYATGSNPPEPLSCGTWSFGEVEDYCVMLSDHVSVKEFLAPSLKIYPNPVDDLLYLVVPGGVTEHEKWNADIFGMDGSIVCHEALRQTTTLDVSGIAPGVYTVIISGDNAVYNGRFVKQ